MIFVGELRDRETTEIAITAAETGHLVVSTLHTINAGQSINRILGMFDQAEQGQMRQRARPRRCVTSWPNGSRRRSAAAGSSSWN